MTPAQLRATPEYRTAPPVHLRRPQLADGAHLWRLATDSGVLDANSSYAYVLWCRDFTDTTVIAEKDGEVVGFITGYRRPAAPDTLFVWQVAVDESQRGNGIGVAMLEELVSHLVPQGVRSMETTVSPDNAASIAMFAALARRRGATITTSKMFEPTDFPDAHEAEELYTITPLNRPEGKF
ncbi:diaminobutyrate acetyltransferase [Skermania sp. ID1734]|uniref:diaminobutyrate acetyltransferase n=1 Tax=Skermania sp. ID1734 TaxID=2597516 RepID=UPI00117C5E7C|nr:diaminobutyrate acetyltransferase [Skermania sp. ID1734]TSE00177.1 diaminobutyrate acetyltransferase [Skermania sp. ID1734]